MKEEDSQPLPKSEPLNDWVDATGWNKIHLWAIIEMIKLWEIANGFTDGNISDVTGILRGKKKPRGEQHSGNTSGTTDKGNS